MLDTAVGRATRSLTALDVARGSDSAREQVRLMMLEEAVSSLPPGTAAVTVDVGGVSFIDSSGLRVLIALAGRAGEEHRALRIEHPSATVVRLVQVTGLGEMFGLTDDPPDA